MCLQKEYELAWHIREVRETQHEIPFAPYGKFSEPVPEDFVPKVGCIVIYDWEALRRAKEKSLLFDTAWHMLKDVDKQKQWLCFLSELHAVGVDLYLHQQGIDTTTPAGKAMFQMMGVFAEFERSMIQERVKSGLARAKKHGTKSGKPLGRPKVNGKIEKAVLAVRANGTGKRKIAKQLGIGVSTVNRIIAEEA